MSVSLGERGVERQCRPTTPPIHCTLAAPRTHRVGVRYEYAGRFNTCGSHLAYDLRLNV